MQILIFLQAAGLDFISYICILTAFCQPGSPAGVASSGGGV